MGSLLRKTALATVAALALVGIVPSVASAAMKPAIAFAAPSPAEGATLTTNSVEFRFTHNKKPSATRTLTCALAGPTASSGACDAPVANGSKGARSGKSYSGLGNGEYTFTVSLTLTDGGTASATRHFTVNVPAPRFQSTCESLGGTYGTGGTIFGFSVTDRCDWASVTIDDWNSAIDALDPFCDGVPANERGGQDPDTGAVGCLAPPSTFQSTCESLGGTYGTGGTIFGDPVSDRCDWASVAIADWLSAIDALDPFCDGVPANERGGQDPDTGAVGCRNPT